MLSGEGRSLENIGVHLQKVTDGYRRGYEESPYMEMVYVKY